MSDMTNEEIIESFDALFGSNEDEDKAGDENPPEDKDGDADEDNPDDESGEGEEGAPEGDEGEGEDEEGDKDGVDKDSQSKQNYKFAEMRNKLKAQENLLKNLGKAIGLDDNTSVEDVANKVNEVLLKKQSQETGIPEDVLQRLQTLEAMAATNQQTERKNNTQNAIANLIETYSLSQEQVDNFVQQLIENGKNPMEVDGVDIETEFIKLNYQTLMAEAIDKAKNEERERQDKVARKAGSGVGGSPDAGGSDKPINTVGDLDNFFNSLDL